MNKLNVKIAILIILTSWLSLATTNIAFAAPCPDANETLLGMPKWYKYLEGENVGEKCKPIIENSSDALPIGLAVFEGALTLGGIVAGAMILYGGFKYVLSQGESDKAAAGRKTAINALIGLVILMMAARIVSFVAGRIG